jgi:hypothetical protein
MGLIKSTTTTTTLIEIKKRKKIKNDIEGVTDVKTS